MKIRWYYEKKELNKKIKWNEKNIIRTHKKSFLTQSVLLKRSRWNNSKFILKNHWIRLNLPQTKSLINYDHSWWFFNVPGE